MSGKYNGPYFDVDEDVVSVWVAKGPLAEIPDDYFLENYGDEDDDPFNPFSSDFGFGFYDHDFVESNCTDGEQVVPIAQLMAPLSDSQSFGDTVAHRAQELGFDKTSYVVLIYRFRYDPLVTGIHESGVLRFVGAFPYVCDE